jgi:sirohydrochlorin cobaltochelatase
VSASPGIGLLLFAHGARDPRWAEPIERIAAELRIQCPDRAVRVAYLEFMRPDLAEAVAGLVNDGVCHRIEVMPLFLGAGGHIRNELPVLMQAAAARHPGVCITAHPVLGDCAGITLAIATAIAAMTRAGTVAPGA